MVHMNAQRSKSEIAAEHAFLVERHLHGDATWVGMSSDAMLSQALTGADEAHWWPSDEGDLGRCEETYRRAPEHLQTRMLPTLQRFRRHVSEGGLYCRGCDNSIGHRATQRGLCESCWAGDHPGEPFFGRSPREVKS